MTFELKDVINELQREESTSKFLNFSLIDVCCRSGYLRRAWSAPPPPPTAWWGAWGRPTYTPSLPSQSHYKPGWSFSRQQILLWCWVNILLGTVSFKLWASLSVQRSWNLMKILPPFLPAILQYCTIYTRAEYLVQSHTGRQIKTTKRVEI